MYSRKCITSAIVIALSVFVLSACGSSENGSAVTHAYGVINGFSWTFEQGSTISIGQSQSSIERAIGEIAEGSSIFRSGDLFRDARRYDTAGGFEIDFNRNGHAVTFTTETANVTDFLGVSLGNSFDDVLSILVSMYGEDGLSWTRNSGRLALYLDENGDIMTQDNRGRGRYYSFRYYFNSNGDLTRMQINWQAGASK